MKAGVVYLIGAGPGDPELLTLKAARVLAQCDVVLLDDLVHRDVLRHCRPDVRVIDVGKRGGCRSTPQAFIERLMARLARRGAVVGRLKGGDPFVFGRGGEELMALRAAGIAVEVVSGVTSGIAVPATLGIPVTHRDLARGVTFVTGHVRPGGTAPDWETLARSGMTLVVYMGVAHVAAIADALLAGGRPGETPVAAIQNGTLPEQISVATTLACLTADVAARRIASPALLVIGDVVALRDGAAQAAARTTAA